VRCRASIWGGIAAGLGIGLAAGLGGCMPVASTQPVLSLSQHWMFGIERMRDDSVIMLPSTNRFLKVLAGMPNVQVVYLGADRNDQLFSSYTGNRLRVYSWLRAENSCMHITYTIYQTGQQEGTFGLVIPALPAGTETNPACVDRAASGLYQALALQGL
jgi:hypothetical protein